MKPAQTVSVFLQFALPLLVTACLIVLAAPPVQAAPSKILVILHDDGNGSQAKDAEAALAKSLSERGWHPVALDEIPTPKSAAQISQPAALDLARRAGIPYLLTGTVRLSESAIKPVGVSLTMANMELNAKLFDTSSGDLVKAFRIIERSSAPDPLIARADVQEKVAASFMENAPPASAATVMQKTPQTSVAALGENLPNFSLKKRETNLAVVIGIENYRSLPQSEFSRRDAELVVRYLESLGFPRRNIEFIADERATRSDIEKAIEGWLPNRVRQDSTVLVYFSGNGAPDPASGDAYLVPFDGDPAYLGVTGYPLQRLYAQLAALPANNKLVLLDSCFSGAGPRSVLAKGVRSLVRRPKTGLRHDSLLVITSSQGEQISSTAPDKGNGIFTYYLLEALREGRRDAAEIYEYLAPRVADEAKRRNVEQLPAISTPVELARGKCLLGS